MASFQLQGMDELIRNIDQMGRKGARIQNKALREGGEIVAQAMRRNVNVSKKAQTHIRDDIHVSRVKGDGIGEKHVDVGPGKKTAWRAKFTEFGTSHHPPYPFAEPAAVETAPQVQRVLIDSIKSGLGL